jgi:acyl-CoA dehydrogenase
LDFDLTDEQRAIKDAVASVVGRYDADYWLDRDNDGEFPRAFHSAMAEAGWLGITMPEAYGGAGLGVSEAAIMMREVCSYGGGYAAASTISDRTRSSFLERMSRNPAGYLAWFPVKIKPASA